MTRADRIKGWREAAGKCPEGLIVDVKAHFEAIDNWSKAMKTLPLDAEISGGRFALRAEMLRYIDEIERRHEDKDAERGFASDAATADLEKAVARAAKWIDGRETEDDSGQEESGEDPVEVAAPEGAEDGKTGGEKPRWAGKPDDDS